MLLSMILQNILLDIRQEILEVIPEDILYFSVLCNVGFHTIYLAEICVKMYQEPPVEFSVHKDSLQDIM